MRFPELCLMFPLMLQPPPSRAATRGASRVGKRVTVTVSEAA